ncbi:MAG: sigma-70 family RNA polymerase sigma factor [Verrucomicrobiota bacterium]
MNFPVAVDALRSHGKLEGDALLADYVQRHRRLIERLCRILLSDSSDAEDATQQTFLLAYQSLLSGTRPHHPRAWLCTIARRECWARDHRRRRERAAPPVVARAEPDPAEQTVLRAEFATMNAGLKELPARQRQAIVLRELAGLSYTQLAATLEVSESAAEALLVRARRNLRDARLGLLLLPFPRSLRRLFRLGSRHARATAGIQATKAVAVVTLVTATTAVAGSTVQANRAAVLSPEVAYPTAPQAQRARKTPHHAVSRIRPAVVHAPRASVEPTPAKPAVSPAQVTRSAPSSRVATESTGDAAPPAAPPATPVTSPEPKAQAPKTVAPLPRATAPRHPKPPTPKPTPTTTTPAPGTTPEPDQSVTTPLPTDPTETAPPPSEGTPSSGSDGQGSQGDTRPGNGNGDKNHDHDGHGGHR